MHSCVCLCCCGPHQPFLDDPAFTPEEVARASSAAEGLCKWVRAMVSFHHISKMIEPKRQALKEATAALSAAEKVLVAKKEQLRAVMEHIQGMMADLAAVGCTHTHRENCFR